MARSRHADDVVRALAGILGGVLARQDDTLVWSGMRAFAGEDRIVLVDARPPALTADAILAALRGSFDLSPDPLPRGSAPARLWRVDGGPATVGVIASVSDAFCGACDRTRLTADGQVRSCLFATGETDLRTLLRSGADTLELATDDDLLDALLRFADMRRQRARLKVPGRFPAHFKRAVA